MIKLENTVMPSADQWKAIIMGCRNPLNSWQRSDSIKVNCDKMYCDVSDDEQEYGYNEDTCPLAINGISCDKHNMPLDDYFVGPNDYDLMKRLRNAGTDHRKFMRMITVYVDITAPLYWWKEFDAYKVGTVTNSCSTMHKIADKEFTLEDFSHEHLLDDCRGSVAYSSMDVLQLTINALNNYREKYLKTKEEGDFTHTPKDYWWQMIQLLPSSYNQRRTIMLNYEVLANIYKSRKNHKLDEWHTFCDWVKTLPYSELITGEFDENTISLKAILGML